MRMKRFEFVFEAVISGSAGRIAPDIWRGLADAFARPRPSVSSGMALFQMQYF
jgi:hypothetical protein